jgi:hypothetical protein
VTFPDIAFWRFSQLNYAWFRRYSDYYISGCNLFAKDVGASFLMSYVACGRPYPVTQHPGDPLSLHGHPCSPHSPCGGGPGRHDSHYVCVKYTGQYLPCGARDQPDYDEIVVFNPHAVLPVASFEFKRRRRTLLWVDDHPENNFPLLCTFPGCPQKSAALHSQAYPMQPHCLQCLHGLAMDPNPHATVTEREKALRAAENELTRVHAAALSGDAVAQQQLHLCNEGLRLAQAALESAKAAADAVVGQFAGRDIKMEEQTDVVLFTSVHDVTRFLRLHQELSKYHSLLLQLPYGYPPMFALRSCDGNC